MLSVLSGDDIINAITKLNIGLLLDSFFVITVVILKLNLIFNKLDCIK